MPRAADAKIILNSYRMQAAGHGLADMAVGFEAAMHELVGSGVCDHKEVQPLQEKFCAKANEIHDWMSAFELELDVFCEARYGK